MYKLVRASFSVNYLLDTANSIHLVHDMVVVEYIIGKV